MGRKEFNQHFLLWYLLFIILPILLVITLLTYLLTWSLSNQGKQFIHYHIVLQDHTIIALLSKICHRWMGSSIFKILPIRLSSILFIVPSNLASSPAYLLTLNCMILLNLSQLNFFGGLPTICPSWFLHWTSDSSCINIIWFTTTSV